MDQSCYLLDEFLIYFGGIKARSKRTIQEYHYDLLLFLRFLKRLRGDVPAKTPLEEISIEDVDAEFLNAVKLSEIYRFISYLAQERDNGPAARARRVASLRAFFDYLHQKARVIDQNPTAELESPKQPKRLPQYLDLGESLALLEAVAEDDSPFASRDYAIITLFLNCGMRLSELCGIDLSDWQGDTIRVIGKGDKERTIYLNHAAQKALANYLEDRPEDVKAGHENAMFLSRNKQRISDRAVQNLVKKHLKAAGLDTSKYSVHKLRHTAATLMYQHGNADLRSLQQILGHESVATTEIYTHVNSEQLHRAVENNPLNQMQDKSFQELKDKGEQKRA